MLLNKGIAFINPMKLKIFTCSLIVLSLISFVATIQAQTQQAINYTYNDLGLIEAIDGPRTDVSDITSYTYHPSYDRASITNALGHTIQLLDYTGRGNAQRIIDENGVESLLTYHARGWLESITIVDPSGNAALNSTTQYTYDPIGQLIQVLMPNGESLMYTYDGARRLTAIENTLGERIDYTLDNAGNRLSETIRSGNNNSNSITYTVNRAFDELSRVMNIIGAEGQTTHLDYDVNSNNTALTNPRNFVTDQVFDPLNRLSQSTDALGGQTQFTYDRSDRLTSVTDANGNTTYYSYDYLDNLIQVDSPDTGITTFEYDSANNRTRMVDSRGVEAFYSYDALNRLTSVIYDAQGCTSAPGAGCPGGALNAPEENVSYVYDQTENGNFGIGRLTQINDQSGSTRFVYDHRGNLLSKTVTLNNPELNNQEYTTAYQYDLGNNATQISYPSGLVVNYTFDDFGRVEAVAAILPNQSEPSPLASNITYLPFGPTTAINYGNGLNYTATYNQDYRLTDLLIGSQVSYSYQYDANGNITAIDHTQQASANQNFSYDSVDRLATGTGNYGQLNFGYDLVGNRENRNQTLNGNTVNETYNYTLGSNQLSDISKDQSGDTTQRNFTLDAKGNPISETEGSKQIDSVYNSANRLSQVTVTEGAGSTGVVTTYTYNALGQRTHNNSSTDNINYLYNEAGQMQSEINNTTVRDYVYLNGQILASIVHGSQASDEFYLVNKATGLKLRPTDGSNGSLMIATNNTDTSNWVRFRQVPSSDGYFYLQNVESGQYFRPMTNADGVSVEQRPTNYSGNRTQWSFSQADDDHVHLVNRWSGKYIRPNTNAVDGPVVQRPASWNGDWTRWRVEPVLSEGSQVYWYSNSHLGTPKVLTDQNQTTVWEASYTPFGEANIETEIVTNNLRFSGQVYDAETGYHYNYFRYYDPSTGRYLRSDPIGMLYDFSDPQLAVSIKQGLLSPPSLLNHPTNHTYAYVDNKPITRTDPSGLFSSTFNPNVFHQPPTRSSYNTYTPYTPSNSSCESKCYKRFIRAAYFGAISGTLLGAAAGGSAIANLALYYNNTAGTIKGYFDISSCLHKCKNKNYCGI